MKRQRLAVRPWTAADSQIASGWWQDCWTSAGVAAPDVPPPAGTVELGGCAASLLAITLDGTTSGLVAASETVGLVVIALRADARGWGYGSEAVSLVEKRSSPSRAFASPRVGLSLYFWLRLGYAPSDEQPYAPHALMLEKAHVRRNQMQDLNEYIDAHSQESFAELFALVRMPSVSARGQAIQETAEHLAATLQELGFDTRIMPKKGGGQPVLYAEQAGDSDRTLLIYNHYDVQPPEPLDEWQTEPFEPTHRDGNVYGRGISDDKGNLVARIAALRAIKETRGSLPARIKFLIEGDEEIGSPLFEEFVEEHRELLKADACLWEGSGVDPQGRPLLPLGVKGLLYVELSCKTVARDVHSSYAAVVPNPAWRLTWALSTLKDQDETVLIDGFYDDVRDATRLEEQAIDQMPAEEREFARSIELERFVLGVEGVDFRKRLYLQPTCNIDGLTSGYQGPGSKTISPARASAKLDFRLVPDQDPHDIAEKLRRHLDKHGFEDIEIEVFGGEHPARTAIDESWVGIVRDTLRSVYEKEPVVVPTMAGTGPMYPVVKLLGVPTADTGVGNIDSRIHAPNENIREEDFVMGIKAAAAVIDAFGKWKPQP